MSYIRFPGFKTLSIAQCVLEWLYSIPDFLNFSFLIIIKDHNTTQFIETNLAGILLRLELLFLYFIHNILCFRCQKLIVSLDPFLCLSSHAVFIIVERFLLPQAISLPVKINTLLYRSKKFIIVHMLINKHPTFCKEILINAKICLFCAFNGDHSFQIKLQFMYIFT